MIDLFAFEQVIPELLAKFYGNVSECAFTADKFLKGGSMVPSGIDTVPKAKITTPKSKTKPGKGGGKDIQ